MFNKESIVSPDLPSVYHIRVNYCMATLGKITIWFSFSVPIAFSIHGSVPTYRVNDWGQSTGRHLNDIGRHRKEDRIPGVEFEARLLDAMKGFYST